MLWLCDEAICNLLQEKTMAVHFIAMGLRGHVGTAAASYSEAPRPGDKSVDADAAGEGRRRGAHSLMARVPFAARFGCRV